MSYVNSNFDSTLSPEEHSAQVIDGVVGVSAAMQAFDVMRTERHALNLPVLTALGGTGWYTEGAEITASDAAYEEQQVVPKKVAAMRVFSSEVADDSYGAIQTAIVDEVSRALAKDIDAAVFGNLGDAAAPAGLGSYATLSEVEWDGETFDAFVEAASNAGIYGLSLRNLVLNPTDWYRVGTVKEASGSARNLVQPDATVSAGRVLNGTPVLLSSGVPQGVAYAVPNSAALLVVRKDAELVSSNQSHFSSDQLAIRAIMRVDVHVSVPGAVTRILMEPSS